MTLTVQLTPEEEAALAAQAEAEGVPMDSLLRRAVLQVISVRVPSGGNARQAADETDLALDEISEMIPVGSPVLPPEAITRDNIYGREDDWNRQ